MQNILNGIKLIIFDMDGLLVDSEPYWKIAEKEVFGKLGLNLNDHLLRQVMGFRLSEVVKYWYEYQAWENPDFVKTETDILETVKQLIHAHSEAMPGVYDLLTYLKQNGYIMALASSSAMELIESVVDKLNIRSFFGLLWSGEFEPFGKPHPGIFLSVAQKFNIKPEECLVFEDSMNGVIAAKAARMKCVAVPEIATYTDIRFSLADLKLKSLNEFGFE